MKAGVEFLLGWDIGGTKCAAVVGEARAGGPPKIVARQQFATSETKLPSPTVEHLAEISRRLLEGREASRLGIACGGPLNSREGLVLSPPNMPGWDEVPLVRMASQATGFRASLMNDANAGALAEHAWGIFAGVDTLVFLTFGTGMGAGLIVGGRLHEGRDDLAGEVGHWRLADSGPVGFMKEGSFEGFCGGSGIARLAALRGLGPAGESRSFEDADFVRALAEVARSGDAASLAVFRGMASRLGDADVVREVAEAARSGDAASLAVFREVGSRLGDADVVRALAEAARSGDAASLAVFREVGSRLGDADVVRALAEAARSGDAASLAVFREVASRLGDADVVRALAEAARSGNAASLAVFREVGSRLGDADVVRALAEAARSGDAASLEVFREVGSRLGQALALLIDLLNPEAIVLGSLFHRCRDLVEAPMREVLSRECLPASLRRCEIIESSFGESWGDVACLAASLRSDE